MKKIVSLFLSLLCFIATINAAYANNQQSPPVQTSLYKDLYYGIPKNEVMGKYDTEQNPNDQSQLMIYDQSFIGFQWDILLTFDKNSSLESVYLATDSDSNGNKLGTLVTVLGKNFSPAYAAHDSSNVDFVSIFKTKGAATYQQAIGDFFMDAVSSSTSLNIIYISNDAFQKAIPNANSYLSMLQQLPNTVRQAELIIGADGEDNTILAVDFTLPKMQILNMQNQQHEEF